MDTREGRYGCTRGPIMGFESRTISARVTKQIVTIFSKTCDKHILCPLICKLHETFKASC